jgi:hypothetical protein
MLGFGSDLLPKRCPGRFGGDDPLDRQVPMKNRLGRLARRRAGQEYRLRVHAPLTSPVR